MNNRIEELAQQAWRHAALYSSDGDGTFGHLFRDKFAELIVKECARVAFESDLTMAIGQWGADSAILKHFNIKE